MLDAELVAEAVEWETAPLGHGRRIDAMTPGQHSQALSTMLYRSMDRFCRGGAPV